MRSFAVMSTQLQAEVVKAPQVERLRGLYCRKILEDSDLIETAARGYCVKCGAVGFYNFMRIMKPKGWELTKALKLGGIIFTNSELTPRLTASGVRAEYYCPPCHLEYLDPINFARKE